MNAQTVADITTSNPDAVRQGQEQLRGILTRSATDPEFRARLLVDPRGAVTEYTGQELPASFGIRFVENAGTATIVLPDYIDADAELSDSELEAVAGGSEFVVLCLTAAAAGVVIGGAVAAVIDHYN